VAGGSQALERLGLAKIPSHAGSALAREPKNSAQFSVVSTARAR
jgi:hypothetical protein